MQPVKALLVEDDEYKINSLCNELPSNYRLSIARSVASAVRAVVESSYDLIILDMALPTFEKQNGGASGSSQPQGGVEVLRALKYAKNNSKIVIVSQFPGIEVDGDFITLEDSVQVLSEKYEIDVVGAIAYDFEDDTWKSEFSEVMLRV